MSPDDESLESVDKAAFRRQLDATLRQRDPAALRAFLLDSGQWQADTIPADVPAAMWMMILASPALGDLHAEAQFWLRGHGHTQEAKILAGHKKSGVTDKRSGDRRQRHKGSGNHRDSDRS
jgi:hypothetical protein